MPSTIRRSRREARSSHALRIGRMKSGRDIAPTGDAYSFNNFGKGTAAPSRNLDHIFYRNTKMAVSFRTLTDNYGVKYVSDHYPILLTVLF